MDYNTRSLDRLDPGKIIQTLTTLSHRIEERFPNSGLSHVCQQLITLGKRGESASVWLGSPIIGLRVGVALLIALFLAVLLGMVLRFKFSTDVFDLGQLIQISEAGLNELVLIGVAIFFLLTIEKRIKRHYALKRLHALRSIAHIIDMHQLTKDPERILSPGLDTKSSPERRMSTFELKRYLDYCSEMLSLTSKVAALYVQNFDDPIVLAAVNDIETLTTGLSRKIWQKIMVLYSLKASAELPIALDPQ